MEPRGWTGLGAEAINLNIHSFFREDERVLFVSVQRWGGSGGVLSPGYFELITTFLQGKVLKCWGLCQPASLVGLPGPPPSVILRHSIELTHRGTQKSEMNISITCFYFFSAWDIQNQCGDLSCAKARFHVEKPEASCHQQCGWLKLTLAAYISSAPVKPSDDLAPADTQLLQHH